MDATKPTSRSRRHDTAVTRRAVLHGAAATPVVIAATWLGTPAAQAWAPAVAEHDIEVSCPELVVTDAGTITGWEGGRHRGAHGDSVVNESVFRPGGACGAGYALTVDLPRQSSPALEVHATVSGTSRALPPGRTGWAVPDGFQLFAVEPWPTGAPPGPGCTGSRASVEELGAWNGTVTRDSKLLVNGEVVRLYTTDYLRTGPVLPDVGARHDRGLGRPVVPPLEARGGYTANRSGDFQQAVATRIDDTRYRFLVQTRSLVHAPEPDRVLLPVPQEGTLEITLRWPGGGPVLARRRLALAMTRVGN
ncbi:hypothetical protein EII34_09105 [Arachnia propionica]|uniref:Uncharacterized protein n=1 Tax=Arachnia propionica TaxID=1750 RepID=A0A3P1T5A6_9ACTN|nr:hypothetical protein [Arachnia propionica]RRD04692.1 hypothetical protein EII34_09105 [Arachnia propionica]